MKPAPAALMLLFIASSLHAAEPKDSFPQFMNLTKREAATTARRQAESDFAAGHYLILVYGLRAKQTPAEERLAKEGVEMKTIAGCIVNEGILEGARVYNEVMRGKLKAKLGRDIFNESNKTESKK